MEEGQIRLGDLPQALLDSLIPILAPYQVALLGVSRSDRGDAIDYSGSGIFVEMRGARYLLTAAHVWMELAKFEEIGLCIRETIHDLTINCADVVPHLISRRSVEWGPDIAYLDLSQRVVEQVLGDRKFLDMRSGGAHPTPDLENGVIAVVGAPAESSVIDRQRAGLSVGPWIGVIEKYHHNGRFDYFDIRVDAASADLPGFFGGVSGGPVWQTFLNRSPTDGKFSWKEPCQLLGIVIKQFDLGNGERFIRCHGPQSIYDKGPIAAGIACRLKPTAQGTIT
jgi:hypothetical protein